MALTVGVVLPSETAFLPEVRLRQQAADSAPLAGTAVLIPPHLGDGCSQFTGQEGGDDRRAGHRGDKMISNLPSSKAGI
jgi:hypothetical protein